MSYGDHQLKPNTDKTDKMKMLSNDLVKLRNEKAELEEKLAVLNSDIARIAKGELVELMADLGMDKITMRDGNQLLLKRNYFASASKSPDKAFDFFKRRKAGIGKRVIHISFDVEEEEEFDVVAEQIHEVSGNGAVVFKQEVHPSTLKAYVRHEIEGLDQQLANNMIEEEKYNELMEDLRDSLNVYIQDEVKVK